MKKMKLAAIFAGLVSVFTFSSCLNDGDSGPIMIFMRSLLWKMVVFLVDLS